MNTNPENADSAGSTKRTVASRACGGGAHSITDTAQRWHRPDLGNSVAAFLFANDDRAYHERTGYELWAERAWLVTPVTVRATWRDDEFDTLASESPFVVFGGDEDWPVNPEIDPGDGRALTFRATLDRRIESRGAMSGFYVDGGYERWGFGGDFEFDAGRVDVRGYAPFGRSFASVRVAAGGRLGGGDTLAPQFLYRLGGAGSVVGYEGLSEDLTGDRMALMNARLHVALPAWGSVDDLYLVGLADIGDAWLPGDEPAWNRGVGGGVAALGRAYLGVFGGYGLESNEWHVYVRASSWF